MPFFSCAVLCVLFIAAIWLTWALFFFFVCVCVCVCMLYSLFATEVRPYATEHTNLLAPAMRVSETDTKLVRTPNVFEKRKKKKEAALFSSPP